MTLDLKMIDHIRSSGSRDEIWIEFMTSHNIETVAEIGVFKGIFAGQILSGVESIRTYYMIDPWKHLDDWNKPANKDDESFLRFYQEMRAATDFAESKRKILHGRTSEVIHQIPDNSLDFAYIDGDHTLRGITIDLVSVLPKVKDGGWIAGDDFSPTIWQHPEVYEPTFVFPFAVYFAEAISTKIYALPYNQFLMQKQSSGLFEFEDLTGSYGDITLARQLARNQLK